MFEKQVYLNPFLDSVIIIQKQFCFCCFTHLFWTLNLTDTYRHNYINCHTVDTYLQRNMNFTCCSFVSISNNQGYASSLFHSSGVITRVITVCPRLRHSQQAGKIVFIPKNFPTGKRADVCVFAVENIPSCCELCIPLLMGKGYP